MNNWLRGIAALGLASGALLFQGCEVDSATDVQREVGVDFTGYYTHPDGSSHAIVTKNSGTAIKSLDLRQGGDQLEAIDNVGNVWKGSLGEFNGVSSSFELNGYTTAGKKGTFSGTLTTSSAGVTNASSSAVGTMSGTYIEDDFFSTFLARATIPGSSPGLTNSTPTNSGSNLTITAALDARSMANITPPPGLWFLRTES